jgi:hypothetical protein
MQCCAGAASGNARVCLLQAKCTAVDFILMACQCAVQFKGEVCCSALKYAARLSGPAIQGVASGVVVVHAGAVSACEVITSTYL